MFFTICDLKANEIDFFNDSLNCIYKQLEIENLHFGDEYLKLNIIFTDQNNNCTFYEESQTIMGNQYVIASYCMDNIRNKNNIDYYFTAFIEEIVHYIWKIYDETKVKYKIAEILQRNIRLLLSNI